MDFMNQVLLTMYAVGGLMALFSWRILSLHAKQTKRDDK